MNITVYLGARMPGNERLTAACRELGLWIGANGHTLIYGGSKSGLMGVLAEGCLDADGRVIGIEPKFFVDDGRVYDRITQLIVTPDIPSRRTKMIEMGDAFIAFPGGTGTLEEVSEVLSKKALNQLSAPCIFYNLDGYYDDMRRQLERMKSAGLYTDEQEQGVYFLSALDEIAALLHS